MAAPLSPRDAAHLLRRVGFGGSPDQIASLVGVPVDRAVDRLLDTSGARTYGGPPRLADPNVDDYQKWVAVTNWWLDRMRTSTTPVVEKMALFWHGHFTSGISKVEWPQAMFDQNQLFRTKGLGSFRELAQAVSVSPAMLRWLDNDKNVGGRPNENFSREFMELFSLGVGHYAQEDVVAAARAWTGHGLGQDRQYVFTPGKHDNGQKTFLGVTKNFDGPQIIDEICNGRSRGTVARFVATKLWKFLAGPVNGPAIDRATWAFVASDLNIRALLRAILIDPAFYADGVRRGPVRSPAEFVVASMKATGLDTARAHPEWYMVPMGQRLLDPPNVSGWGTDSYWVSSSAFWARAGFARNVTWEVNKDEFLKDLLRMPVPAAVQRAFEIFGITEPSPATRRSLEAWMNKEREARSWAERPNLITLLLLSPDFHLA
jgi:uncharacterized protein (DUF1800 family)